MANRRYGWRTAAAAYSTASVALVVLALFLQFAGSNCSLNLYLDKDESHHFLGIPSEIYYIQAGRIQKNALERVLKVPENYHTIHFNWESLTLYSVPYTVDVQISDKKLLRSVTLNVSNQGYVPSTKETVMIQFTCNGLQDARVVVDFNLKFTAENSSVIDVTFKREKFCVKEAQKISFDIDQQPLTESSDSSQLKIFYIVLCFGCSLFTLLILCFLAYVVSNKKDSRQSSLRAEQHIRLRPSETENTHTRTHTPYILSASAVNSGTSTSSNISHSSVKKRKNYTQLDNRSLDLQDRISEITIQRKRIRLQRLELEGTFGHVYVGTYTKEDGSEEEVIVKTVMDFASSNQISLLLREGLTMYGLKHKNIMSVLGVSIEDHVEPFVIYLREGFTNLKKYLQKCKLCQEGITHILTTQEVVEIALQIISGIQYMHKKKLLHKDLATRNCLIDGCLNVKVADNALSRDLFPNDYHCLGDNENRPVKWLAIESLMHRTFSTASDVWSFGVSLWELTTLGQQPYVEVDPFEVEHYLKDGYRLSQPVNCPDELFAVMAYCWAMSADERPTFSQLLTCLQDFRNQLNKYV
ncbi:tyrosine-protein kinase Dnt [Planococcus citri]|uniref:tyrosine-protein kinase Dnt n=1 Tax=Planococcus citri TaxID=170843 RepID=UPI0031F8D1DC